MTQPVEVSNGVTIRESHINRRLTSRISKVFQDLPKVELTYFAQVLLIYIIVITCIVNLSLFSENHSLWSSILSGCIGYMLPAPNFKKKDDTLLRDATQ